MAGIDVDDERTSRKGELVHKPKLHTIKSAIMVGSGWELDELIEKQAWRNHKRLTKNTNLPQFLKHV